MKPAVLGGTGRSGSQVVQKLAADGHESLAASPPSGVDLIARAGLATALTGVDVVLNLTNSPTFGEKSLQAFAHRCTTSSPQAWTKAYATQVVLSIVGTDRVPQLDYYWAKALQEGRTAFGTRTLLHRGSNPVLPLRRRRHVMDHRRERRPPTRNPTSTDR